MYLHLHPPCLVWGLPAQAPGTSCSAIPAARSMDGWSGLCRSHSSPIAKPTKASGLQIPWVPQPGNMAGSCVLLTRVQAAPAGLYKAVVKGSGATWVKGLDNSLRPIKFYQETKIHLKDPARGHECVCTCVLLPCVARSKASCRCSAAAPFLSPATPAPFSLYQWLIPRRKVLRLD